MVALSHVRHRKLWSVSHVIGTIFVSLICHHRPFILLSCVPPQLGFVTGNAFIIRNSCPPPLVVISRYTHREFFLSEYLSSEAMYSVPRREWLYLASFIIVKC